jgi:hypothetical protein
LKLGLADLCENWNWDNPFILGNQILALNLRINGFGRNNLKKNVVTKIIKSLEKGTVPVLAIFRKPSMLN